MEIAQAYELVTAPFVLLNDYKAAEAAILEQCASVNQRALYANLPEMHQQHFLAAIVKHRLVASVVAAL
jgi:hypothetical protein